MYIYSAPDLGLLSHFQLYRGLAQLTPLYYQLVDPVDVVMLSSEDSSARSSSGHSTSDASSSASPTPVPSASLSTFGGLSPVQHITPLASPAPELLALHEEHLASTDIDMTPPHDPADPDIVMIDSDSSSEEEDIPQGTEIVMLDSSSSEEEEDPSEGTMVIELSDTSSGNSV